jgi:hypothetical protein
MFTKLTSFSILSLFLLLFSCSNGSDSSAATTASGSDPRIDAAYKAVMAVHDEVMPEMGTIHRLRKQLKDKVAKGISDEKELANAIKMISTLDAADEGMMSWMAAFKMPEAGSPDEQLAYLASEQSKIDKVSQDMRGAIEEAKRMLGF